MSNSNGSRGGWAPRGRSGGSQRSRGGNRGAGQGAGRGQGRGASQRNAPLHAPTGPSAGRQGGQGGYAGRQDVGNQGAAGGRGGYQVSGGGDRGGYTPSHAGRQGGFGDGNTITQGDPTMTAPKPLNPADFMPPKGDYVDQSAVGPVGVKPSYPDCLRCAEPKGISHPPWMDCKNICGFCHKPAHPGLPCPQMYCSDKWWKDHLGRQAEGVQRRPSEMQRERLAEADPFFASFPQPLHPRDKRAEESKKRSYADTMNEVELAKWNAGEDVLKRQKRELEFRVEEEKGRTAEAEHKASKEKLARLRAEQREADLNDAKVSLEFQNAQLQRRIAEHEANYLRFAEEIASRESAVENRERAKYDSALQAVEGFWQGQFADLKAKTVDEAKKDAEDESVEEGERNRSDESSEETTGGSNEPDLVPSPREDRPDVAEE